MQERDHDFESWMAYRDEEFYLCRSCHSNDPRLFSTGTCLALFSDHDLEYMECLRCSAFITEQDWMHRHEALIAKEIHATGRTSFFTPSLESHLSISNVVMQQLYDNDSLSSIDGEKMENCIMNIVCACGNNDPNKFSEIPDGKGKHIPYLKYCHGCGEVIGVDDTITKGEFIEFLQHNTPHMDACKVCGNTDIDKHVLEQLDDTIALRCTNCDNLVVTEEVEDEKDEEKTVPEQCIDDTIFQCPCGNSEQVLFQVKKDNQGYPYEIDCIKCGQKVVLGSNVKLKCFCGNFDPMQFAYIHGSDGSLASLRCLLCQCDLMPKKWLEKDDLSIRGKTFTCAMTRIISIYDLEPADHITWHRPLGYWHHAIVTKVGTIVGQLKVIEYDGPVQQEGSIIPGGQIVEHWITPQLDEFYRLDYTPSACNPPDKVLMLARQRLGEKHYGLLSNNCEHFARSSKLNTGSSLQVENFKDTLKRLGFKFLGILANRGTLAGSLLLRESPGAFMKVCLKAAGKIAASPVGSRFGGGVVVALVEGKSLLRDIHSAWKQKKAGMITKDIFVKIVIKRSFQTAGTVSGGAIGSVVGSFGIPVPVVGSVLGAFIGLPVGSLLGALLGRKAIHLLPSQ